MGKIKRNDHENHTLQRDTFLETVFKVSARVCSYIFYIIWEISFNAIAYSIYLSFLWVEVPWIFMRFSFCQYAKFPEIQKKKYIPEDNYQWNESCKYEACKTKYLQRWNVILTNENDAILWVTAITMVSEIKKHITVGLQFVKNKEIV